VLVNHAATFLSRNRPASPINVILRGIRTPLWG
jgi:hypothetical protein